MQKYSSQNQHLASLSSTVWVDGAFVLKGRSLNKGSHKRTNQIKLLHFAAQ